MSASIDILNCSIGTVASKEDHSVSFRVNTPELKVSEAGQIMQLHGRACRVILFPSDEEPTESVKITTMKAGKSPSQKLRAALYALHQHQELSEPFQPWYDRQMTALIDSVNAKLE